MRDFLSFRRMLTPLLIQGIFWLSLVLLLVVGVVDLVKGEIISGLEVIFIGPILSRIICEMLVLFFRMNESLTDIQNKLPKAES